MFDQYILDENKNPVKASIEEYAAWSSLSGNKKIGSADTDKVYISTVFLGIDHRYSEEGAPVLFETMVFPQESFMGERCIRYCTFEEAIKGHKTICEEYSAVERNVFSSAVIRWLTK